MARDSVPGMNANVDQDVTRSMDAIRAIVSQGLGVGQIDILTAAAHDASVSLPADPTAPTPADTTQVSTSGGPC